MSHGSAPPFPVLWNHLDPWLNLPPLLSLVMGICLCSHEWFGHLSRFVVLWYSLLDFVSGRNAARVIRYVLVQKNTNRVCILCMLFHLTVLCWIWSFIWTCAWCNPVCSKESTAFFRWFIEYFMWNWFVRISMFIIVKNFLVRYFFPFMKRQRKREETNNFGILIL